MQQRSVNSGELYTMKKFLNSYVNQNRFYGKKQKPTNIFGKVPFNQKSSFLDSKLSYKQQQSQPVEMQSYILNQPDLPQTQKYNHTGLPSLNFLRTPPLLKHQCQVIIKTMRKTKASMSLPHITKIDVKDTTQQREQFINGMLQKQGEGVLDHQKNPYGKLIGYSKLQRRYKKTNKYLTDDIPESNQDI